MLARGIMVAIVLCLACGPLAGPAPAQVHADHVFLVVIDGCAPRYLERLEVPNVRSLMGAGAYTLRAVTVEPSLTLPAMASMTSGLPVRRHNVDWDDWRPQMGPMKVSSVFTEARRAGLRCAGFVGPRKLEHLAPEGVFDVFYSFGQTDQIIMDAAIEHLRDPNQRTALYLIHLPDTEAAGLRYGWGSIQYMNAVLEADRQDVNVETIMRVPWIVAGVGVRQDYPIPETVRVYDTAPTIMRLLGLDAPETWEGEVPERALVY
jgi:hypothetical protein